MTKTLKSAATVAAMAVLALGAAACGDDEPKAGEVSTGDAAPPVLRLSATEAGKSGKLTAPAEARPGVTKISLRNQGKKTHEAQIVRIEGDHTSDEVLEAIASEGKGIPDWILDGGGVGVVEPGRTGEVIQDLKPGRYVAFDTAGVDNPRNAGTAEFTVGEDDASEADFPETSATITAKDYSFETSGLKAGDNVITFENTGKELHHAVILPVKPGAKWSDVVKGFQSEKGSPPVDEENGVATAVLDGGNKQVTRIPMEAGKYAFACFITDRAGGPPHIAKGMLTEVDVK